MTKKLLILGLLALALALGGCAAKPGEEAKVPDPTLIVQQPAMANATRIPSDSTDPTDEEDKDREYVDPALAQGAQGGTAASSLYAGATPIPLNPIDMPTPTTAPPLTFTYAPYTATKLGLTFESVAGYTVDDSESSSYLLTEPAETVKDNYPVTIQLTIKPVTNGYTVKDIGPELRAALADLGKANYQRWEPSANDSRELMNAQGMYANYRGVMTDGTIVRGRIHMALLPNNRLLILHISNPANFNTDYDTVYAQIRKTLKTI